MIFTTVPENLECKAGSVFNDAEEVGTTVQMDRPQLKVFTADGKYIRQYGGGQLQGPAGVTVDQDGYCLEWKSPVHF